MMRRCPALGLALALTYFGAQPVHGQGLGAARNDLPDAGSHSSRMGRSPGDGANPLDASPGAGDAVLEGKLGSPGPRFIPQPFPQILPEISEPGVPSSTVGRNVIGPPLKVPTSPITPFGSLGLSGVGEDEGPANGLTLDQAIERLIKSNLDLYSKSFEIPQAEADVLTAGLRANPVLYTDVQCVPYGDFSIMRPGGQTQYDINITYPLDLSRKRQSRTLVAVRAKKVLQAQFQDAIRLQIDNLYTEFVDVLATRETVREARKAVQDLRDEAAAGLGLKGRKGEPPEEDLRLEVLQEAAEIAVAESVEQLKSDLRTLGSLLRLSPDQAERIQVRGSLHEKGEGPASMENLLQLALTSRPDLVAYRLGVGRADADVKLALANRYPDVFVMYQPYTFQNNRPLGRLDATSWGIGMAVSLPIFNRNQGNIQRAKLNVTQTQAELAALEEEVVAEVRQAGRFYSATRAAIERIERSLLPKAVQEHERVTKLRLAGKVDELAFLTAEQDFDRVVRQYRDTLVKHRRSMLKVNTSVGCRVLP